MPLADDNALANDKCAVELTVMFDMVIVYEKRRLPNRKVDKYT
jgi:hypothetical protein